MKKDTFYFSHDANAKDDPKCMALIDDLGLEGYGIFWILVETLRNQPDYRCPLNIIKSVARRYNTTQPKVEVVVRNYGLFTVDDDEFFFSESLLRRMQVADKKRKLLSSAGKAGNAKRWGEKNKDLSPPDSHPIATQSQLKERKVKESKVKESIIKIDLIESCINDNSNDGSIDTLKSPDNSLDSLKTGKNEDFTPEKYHNRIKIGANEYFRSVSDLLDKEYRHLLETAILTNLKGFSESQIFNAMDEEYPFYEFRDENHFWNSLKGIAKKIKRVSFEKSTPHQMFDANKSAKEKLGIKNE